MDETMRLLVCSEARRWVGTPYHHMARVCGPRGGVDCATLLAEVYEAVGLAHIEISHYPQDWHMHRDAERYMSLVAEHSDEVPESDALPGDVVLFRIGRLFSHGAIVVDPGWPRIVHAHMESGEVREDCGDRGRLTGRPRRFFRPRVAAQRPVV